MTGKDIERAEATQPTVVQLIQNLTPQLSKALPEHLKAERIARIAITLIRGNDKLEACDPHSFIGALMTAAQLGLEPGPLGECYLVPYGKEVTFIPGYKGLIKLAYQSAMVREIGAHIVYANDSFDYTLGLDPKLHHKPTLTDRGEEIGVYAYAVLSTGRKPFVVMGKADVEKIHQRFKRVRKATQYKPAEEVGPWVTDRAAMVRKTAVRQLARWLPLSPDLRDFNLAANLDGSIRREITSERPDQDPTEFPPPAELEAGEPAPTGEEIRELAAAARHAEPEPADEETMARIWHEEGHPTDDGTGPRERHVWVPEDCPLCPARETPEGQPLATHYYGHTKDWVDGCGPCEQEHAWKDEEAAR